MRCTNLVSPLRPLCTIYVTLDYALQSVHPFSAIAFTRSVCAFLASGVLSRIPAAPARGSACVFYTMGSDGDVDPSSFHFGASVVNPCAGKWTLQFFKELPAASRSPAGRVAYARKIHPLA